jgi:hypothetical protein
MTVKEMGPVIAARSPALSILGISFFGEKQQQERAALASRPRPD